MIKLILNIKHNCPAIWQGLEKVNGLLFRRRGRKALRIARPILGQAAPEGFSFSLVSAEELPALSEFLLAQPEESLAYFRPHLFDVRTLRRLMDNPSFLMMKVTTASDGRIVGYFFLRCFFAGAGVAGLIVDEPVRNQGLGTSIWKVCRELCRKLHLMMFATISEYNIPSLKSCGRGTQMKVVKKMADDYMLVKCK